MQNSVTSLPRATVWSGGLWVTVLHSMLLSAERKNEEIVKSCFPSPLAHPEETQWAESEEGPRDESQKQRTTVKPCIKEIKLLKVREREVGWQNVNKWIDLQKNKRLKPTIWIIFSHQSRGCRIKSGSWNLWDRVRASDRKEVGRKWEEIGRPGSHMTEFALTVWSKDFRPKKWWWLLFWSSIHLELVLW